MKPTYVIAGGGVAATSAAEALRGDGFDGRILVIAEEAHAPYERPPLSKALLRGEIEPAAIRLRTPEFYERNAIELLLGRRVSGLQLKERLVKCNDGAAIPFSKLLIATGAMPRQLRVAGSDLPGVHYLHWLNDAIQVRNSLTRRPRVLVVGTGFIGCEVAASARQIGCNVALVGPSLPMEHVLGKEIAGLYSRFHRDHGVKLKSGATVAKFCGGNVLEAARLSDGNEIECDVAIVGIGVVPDTAWLPEDIKLSDGVETDEFCRTSVEDVFAAGDVACSWRPRSNRRVRLEHFDNAESQGAAAGRTMLGAMRPYDPIPFFWSDQYDLYLQYYGQTWDWDRVVMRGREKDDSFIAFYLKGDRIDAACAINRSKEANVIKRLIGRSDVSVRTLADDGIPLNDLALPPARDAIAVREKP